MTPDEETDLYCRLCNLFEYVTHGGDIYEWDDDFPVTSSHARKFANIVFEMFGVGS